MTALTGVQRSPDPFRSNRYIKVRKKKDRSILVQKTYPKIMIAKAYHDFLKNELNHGTYLLLAILVSTLQVVKQIKLEVLAESLPLPILFESRRKKLRRFLRLEQLSIENLWFPCVTRLLERMFEPGDTVYIAIDRTSWGLINILMVSVIYDHRAWPLYWTRLEKKGNSNLDEQKAVLRKCLGLLSEYIPVVLGDREFHSPKLGKCLGERGMYFCLRQKYDAKIKQGDGLHQVLRDLGITSGIKLFLNDFEVTKKGFWPFNIACK